MKKLRIAAIGCGGRTLTYVELAAKMPQYYEVVAAADPRANRVELARKLSGNPAFKSFVNDQEILAQPKLADIMIIATQDAYHFEPAKAAMEKGYNLLLEKPIAQKLSEVVELEKLATKLGRKVLVCHVLRYTPFYRKVKEIVESGIVGEIATLNATEGVGPWHQGHSFVRGHWAVTAKATPMIIAKSCHDTDILAWLVGKPCRSMASFGALSHFRKEHAPAGAPPRCTDGCPVGMSCPYNALRYLTNERGWLQYVFDTENEKKQSGGATTEEVMAWLSSSPWGRCVYQCDNTAVDHQVLGMRFEGDVTATFTMTAFTWGRHLEIYGTKGFLRGGEFVEHTAKSDIVVVEHATGNETRYHVNPMAGGYGGHGGGDPGLMLALYDEMMKENPREMHSSIHKSVESHVMGFAAEEARVKSAVIDLREFAAKHGTE